MGFVLDGEVIGKAFVTVCGDTLKKNAQAEDSVFNVFDIIP